MMKIEDVTNILIKVKDGILKFYVKDNYIYCKNTKTNEIVKVGVINEN